MFCYADNFYFTIFKIKSPSIPLCKGGSFKNPPFERGVRGDLAVSRWNLIK
jgi:hypothetical protein